MAIAAHVISGLGNDLLGWVIIISFELTGSEGKFQYGVFSLDNFCLWFDTYCGERAVQFVGLEKGYGEWSCSVGKKILAVYDIVMTLVPLCVLVCGLCAVGLGKVKLTDEVCRMALDNM